MAESMHERMMRQHAQGSKSDQPKLLMYETTLKAKQQIAKGTWAFTFKKPMGFRFTAGQHVRMTLINPPETDAEGDSRFLSLASTPGDLDLLVAMRMRDTAFKRVLNTMTPGTKVRMQIGEHVHEDAFILHKDSSRPAVFLVGGIGIVPAYSMICDALERQLPHQIVLLYSNRQPEDAPFLAELHELAERHTNFTFVPTMTDIADSNTDWQGAVGRIDQSLLERYIPDTQTPIYYIAGLSSLVETLQALLNKMGLKRDDIKAEEYAGFNMNHSGNPSTIRGKLATFVARIRKTTRS
jgi:ferredoxin-NADP reductase